VPIIVLSADGAEDRKVDALEHGADDYMTKRRPRLSSATPAARRPRTQRPLYVRVRRQVDTLPWDNGHRVANVSDGNGAVIGQPQAAGR
jgi:PleD family two-component response regulator